jgi:DNA repair photolyase
MGAGTDFERRIVVKVNAAEALREEIVHREWSRQPINFSGVTDPYQPLEASYGVTRACMEVCAEIDNPVSVVTKGALVRRDAELLGELAQRAPVRVYVSIPFADDEAGRALEPHATVVSQRFETLAHLSEAGVPTGVAVAPVMPGMNDADIPEILERAADAGAEHAFTTLLRLPGSVEPVFVERLREAYPDRADRILNGVREMRGGQLNSNEFGERMSGKGPRWQAISTLFETQCRRLGLNQSERAEVEAADGPADIQPSLFDEG